MTPSFRTTTRVGALVLTLAITACSHGPKAGPQLAPIAAPTPANEIDTILSLLDLGEVGAAKKRIAAILKSDPMNPSAQVLRASIDEDPKALLGPTSFAYVTQPGDTMSGLAQRFLGNRLKSYQLARYNGIAKPADLTAGQTLRIPGVLPRAQMPKRIEPRSATPAALKARSATPKPVSVAKPSPVVVNPGAARQARVAGLAALNAGNVARAVGLLHRAAALDPRNPVISRDLARAERIAATVKARK